MKYFDLVRSECIKINKIIDSRYDTLFFIEASLQKIVYGDRNNFLIFSYAPERNEYGEIMILKGLIIRSTDSTSKEYPINQIVSFLQNDCQFFEEKTELISLKEQLNNYDSYKVLRKIYPEWELKYQEYIKKKYPW